MLTSNTNFLNDEELVVEFIHYLCVQYFRTKKVKENVANSVAELGLLDVDKAWNILSNIFSTTLGWSIYIERSFWSAVILVNHTKTSFLTGDQPIINTYAAFGYQVKEHDHLEFYYPLSPNKALLLTKNSEFKGVHSKVLSEAEVARFNDAILDLAHEQIYAATKFQLNEVAKNYNKHCTGQAAECGVRSST
jgi:hypothetical protein